MGWSITDDLERYLAETGEFLRADPVENTVPLSVIETLRAQGSDVYGEDAVRFGWWRSDAGRVSGAFLHTRPFPLLLSAMPELASRRLADTLADQGASLPGVNGEQRLAGAFADTWRRHTGAGTEMQMHQRLYRLDRLEAPDPLPPGTSRLATAADLSLVLAWLGAFQRDIRESLSAPEVLAADRLSYSGIALWEVDGVPVSLAGRTRVVADMARVGPVYTPPEHRRRGYAAAATATITQAALEAGAREVVLFTDLANPTSNGVYQRLGYRPVSDRVVLSFTAGR